jgi:hypothetical protein
VDFDGIAKEAIQAAMQSLGVGDAGTFTVSTLPNPTDFDRRTIWCSDLHDGIGGRLVSESGFWKPIRPLAIFTQVNSNQNMTIYPLLNSPTQIMPTTLTVSRTLTIATKLSGVQVAYPGQRFRIRRNGGGLFPLVINTIGLSLNSWADFEYDPIGDTFVQTASGGLL